jgi:hypothetical protein
MSSYRYEMVRVEQNLVSTVGRDQISFIIENVWIFFEVISNTLSMEIK